VRGRVRRGAGGAFAAARRGCLESIGYFASAYLPPSTPPLGAGPHALQVTDHDERICFALGRRAHVPEECALPPVDPHRTC
jgi:hypothetical protein